MSRLFRYCSAQAIAPDAVSDLVLADFGAFLKAETLIKDPRVTHQNTCRVWNHLAEQVPGWPNVRLTVPRYADHYIRAWSEFPSSFQDEVEAYLANLQHDDVLNRSGSRRSPTSSTRAMSRTGSGGAPCTSRQ